MTGKIQSGVASAGIAQVIVPALAFSPTEATGTDPMPPGTVTLPEPLSVDPLPEPPLLQAASTVVHAIARASLATFVLRNFVGPPSVPRPENQARESVDAYTRVEYGARRRSFARKYRGAIIPTGADSSRAPSTALH